MQNHLRSCSHWISCGQSSVAIWKISKSKSAGNGQRTDVSVKLPWPWCKTNRLTGGMVTPRGLQLIQWEQFHAVKLPRVGWNRLGNIRHLYHHSSEHECAKETVSCPHSMDIAHAYIHVHEYVCTCIYALGIENPPFSHLFATLVFPFFASR